MSLLLDLQNNIYITSVILVFLGVVIAFVRRTSFNFLKDKRK